MATAHKTLAQVAAGPDIPVLIEASPDPSLDLATFFREHFEPAQLKGRAHGTCRAYSRAMDRFRVFVEREPILADLHRDNCERFERWLEANGCATKSGHDGYRCVVAVWRYAFQLGIVDNGPPMKRKHGSSPAEKFLSDPAKPTKPTLLIDFTRQYAIERGLSPASARHLRHVLNSFGRSLNRRPRLSDLCDASINRWIVELQEQGKAPETVRRHKISVVGLWRAAAEVDLVSAEPRRIRKVKVPQKLPTAWSQAELSKLLAAAIELPGKLRFGALSRSSFWVGWILVAYHSGLRRADLLKLRFDQINADGRLAVVQSKTGLILKGHLPATAMQAIRATVPPARRLVFGDVFSPGRLRKEFAMIVKAAGLRGSSKKLRATGATWCEADTPGSAMRFLGHRTPGLAYRSYVDPRHLQETINGPRQTAMPVKKTKGGAP